MSSDPPTLHCPNPLCQSLNPELDPACQRCGTPLKRLYLWLVGDGAERFPVGTWVSDAQQNPAQCRYRLVAPQIVLDTKPSLLPDSPLDISLEMEPYLRLSNYKLAVPQVYGVQNLLDDGPRRELLLLENAPILDISRGDGAAHPTGPLPPLVGQWANGAALRQLNWLWQMAGLWDALVAEGVAGALVNPDLVRVEGDLVRLLALPLDRRSPTIADLGYCWQSWLQSAQGNIREFLGGLCQEMVQGRLTTGAAIVAVLESALQSVGRSHPRHIALSTGTDQGPTRQRNEDACYPAAGTAWSWADPSIATVPLPLLLVCDGIGGHEGGNVASGLAIAHVQGHLQTTLAQTQTFSPALITRHLEQAVLIANDAICQRNDKEKRQERQRMGTTLVLSLIHHHDLYLTHVGDSRAYRITRSNCHQVTLDDDLASREARLGYSLYRHALQKPSAGALIQALGMSASSMLHPTTQRFVLDEDCLFLLCSDGLSDNDLVDRIWQSDLLPVLEGKLDVELASQKLIEIANRQNGHDNVTVGLIHCQVSPQPELPVPVNANLVPQTIAALSGPALPAAPAPASALSPTDTAPTQLLRAAPKGRHPVLMLLGIMGLWAIGGGLAYAFLPGVRLWLDTLLGNAPQLVVPNLAVPTPESTVSVPPAPESPAWSAALPLGTFIQVNRAALDNSKVPRISLVAQPETPPTGTPNLLPLGTVLQISSRQEIPHQGAWLKIKVCSIPDESRAVPNVPPPGTLGWVAETAIAPLVNPKPTLQPNQQGTCLSPPAATPVPPVAPPAPSPVPPLPPAAPAPSH